MTWLYAWDDRDDRWLGADKVEHVLGGMCAYLLAARVTSGVWPWLIVLGLGTLVEGVELLRFRAWERKDKPPPWPWLTDKVSRKDLVADLLGALLAAVFLWIVR